MVAAILAGGRSRRMGFAKATAALGGRSLISYPVAAAERAGLEPVVVAKPGSDLPALDCAVVREAEERSHPLAGILAALDRAGEGAVLAVGCDMPFLVPELLTWLASLPEPLVVPAVGGQLHPLLARYSGELAEPLASALADEEPVHRALERLERRIVDEDEIARFGDPQRLLFNVNSPADLQLAEELLATDSTSTSAL